VSSKMDNLTRPVPELIAEIITSTKVKRVVCVDDDFALGATVDTVQTLCLAFPAEAKLIEELNAVEFDEDPEVWKEQLRKVWAELDNPKKEEVDRKLRDHATRDQLTPVQGLKEWFPSDRCTFVAMSWAEWQKNKDEVLEAATGEKTLLLVDQDLSREGGRRMKVFGSLPTR